MGFGGVAVSDAVFGSRNELTRGKDEESPMARLLPFDLEPQFWLRRSKGGWTVRSTLGSTVKKFSTRDKAMDYARTSSPSGNCTIFHDRKRRSSPTNPRRA